MEKEDRATKQKTFEYLMWGLMRSIKEKGNSI